MKNLKNKAYTFLIVAYVCSLLTVGIGLITIYKNQFNTIIGTFSFFVIILILSIACITPIILKTLFSDVLLSTQKELDDLRANLRYNELKLVQKADELKVIENFLKHKIK